MDQQFYSNGKLLITGEYVVLDGAIALALPTKKGQSLSVNTNTSNHINWTSYDCHHKSWYHTQINTAAFLKTTPPQGNSNFDHTLFKILWHAQQLNPSFLKANQGFDIETHLTFERLWGLGTSSTLINNIANWAKVNPFELLQLSFGGSGYDIACAKYNSAILYQKTHTNTPNITPVNFAPPFKDQLFFIYLNEKKDSKEAIATYRKLDKTTLKPTIETINSLTKEIIGCDHINTFKQLINTHEQCIASLLKTPTIKQQRFPDYEGSIKSLGGWGGDFVMATGTFEDRNYFHQKGYTTVIPFNQMIL